MAFKKKTPASVESITAKLHDTVAELESHAEGQRELANHAKRRIADAQVALYDHNAEHERANKVAGNIKALLGA